MPASSVRSLDNSRSCVPASSPTWSSGFATVARFAPLGTEFVVQRGQVHPAAQASVIETGQEQREGQRILFVRDNGVVFSLKSADKLFEA